MSSLAHATATAAPHAGAAPREPVPMTDEQRFFFDLRGWILLPQVLTEPEIEAMKAEVYGGARNGYEGALQNLLDHPAITGILSEILSERYYWSDECYSFRCENSFTTVRPTGWSTTVRGDSGRAHVVRPPQQANAMRYQVAGNQIFAGLTRVVWELEEVRAGRGGTSFLSGSHKAHFAYGSPDPLQPNAFDSPWEAQIEATMEDYRCPPGSAIIFTESLLHAANDWTDPDNPRCAVFNCYNSVWAQWHRLNLSHETISAMPPKRQTLFRGVWELGGNRTYSADNRSV